MQNQGIMKGPFHRIKLRIFLVFLSVLLPLVAWGAMLLLRPTFVNLYCLHQPALCAKSTLNQGDRMTVGLNSSYADGISLWTQNASGIFSFFIPMLFTMILVLRRCDNLGNTLRSFMDDWIFLLQTLVWNGCIVELIRLIAQRPRPFVYENPSDYGANPWNYNSFVSGHTSFSASMGVALVLLLIKHRADLKVILSCGLVSQSLVLTTALCRVLAGRHFLADVIGAIVGGSIIPILIVQVRNNFNISFSFRRPIIWRLSGDPKRAF